MKLNRSSGKKDQIHIKMGIDFFPQSTVKKSTREGFKRVGYVEHKMNNKQNDIKQNFDSKLKSKQL